MKKLIVLDNNIMEVYVYSFDPSLAKGDDVTERVEEFMRSQNHRPSECSWMLTDRLTLVIDNV